MTERYYFALDLVDDESRIAEYEAHHQNMWPEVLDSFRRAGIENLELYRTGNRLMMMLETNEQFSFEKKKAIDEADAVVQQWEKLMSGYQQSLPWSKGEKWVLMQPIYKLNQ